MTYPDARIAIIIPVLDDGPSLGKLIDALGRVPAIAAGSAKLIVVDDGSLPSLQPINTDEACMLDGEIIRLKRNLGHQRAIAIGLSHVVATNEAGRVVVMDGDGEDRPEDVARILDALNGKDMDCIAVGERASRSEGLLFTAFYHLYRILFRVLTGQQIRFGNFLAMTIGSARRLVDMSELWLNLPATVIRSRLPIAPVPTSRGHRYVGTSRMNLVSLVVHGLSAMAVFMERLLTRVILAAAGLAVLGLAASLIAIAFKIAGLATPGWMTTVVGTSLVVIVMTGALALIGLIGGLAGSVAVTTPPAAGHRQFIAEILPLFERRTTAT